MTAREKKKRLRKIIEENIPPDHCASCDEWRCNMNQDKDSVGTLLKAVWKEVKTWDTNDKGDRK